MFSNTTWNTEKSSVVKNNVGKFFRNCKAKGLQSGTIEKNSVINTVLVRNRRGGTDVVVPAPRVSFMDKAARNKKKKVFRVKPLKITKPIVLPVQKKKKKKITIKRKIVVPQQPNYISNEMLKTSTTIYDRLEGKMNQRNSNNGRSLTTTHSQPILPEVKERLSERYNASLQNHKKRYGTHHLLRGEGLRWFVKERSGTKSQGRGKKIRVTK